jgi:hypothetical protein
MSEEIDLGSREKSPESVELTPAIEIERERLSDASEVSQEIIAVGKVPTDVEMLKKDPERSKSQGNFDMQTVISMMQQLSQQFQQSKIEAKQDLGNIVQELKENQKQFEERAKQDLKKNSTRIEGRAGENAFGMPKFKGTVKERIVRKISYRSHWSWKSYD